MASQAQPPAGMQNRSGGAVPEFLRVVIADEKPASARAVAEKAVLALNSSMMCLYDEPLETFKRNMIEVHQVQHGGVQVVRVGAVLDGPEPELVGGAVGHPAVDAAAGQPDGEAPVVVVAPVPLGGGRAAEAHGPKSVEKGRFSGVLFTITTKIGP
jgi:hypothetical protein